MNDLQKIGQEYFELLSQQKFDESTLDYTIFEKQKSLLNQLSEIKNSGVTVFDLHKKEHIYNSYNLQSLFGYDLSGIDTDYYNSKVHFNDRLALMHVGVVALKYFYALPTSEKKNYKLQNEYRILNAEEKYIRVIEQFQALELDKKGNLWLALSTMDISPNQEEYGGIRSQLINVSTGEYRLVEPTVPDPTPTPILSKREKEIFSHIRGGLLSKEISDKLSISVHTVNTHRQNILKKLGANNSIEALHFARNLNLA